MKISGLLDPMGIYQVGKRIQGFSKCRKLSASCRGIVGFVGKSRDYWSSNEKTCQLLRNKVLDIR